MKKFVLFIFIFFPLSLSFAIEAPKYLAVPGWKNCTSVVVRGSTTFVCMPASQPFHCPSASWKLLQNQKLIEPCLK
jgi:hypothetical protein